MVNAQMGWMDSGMPMQTSLNSPQYWDGYRWVSSGGSSNVSSTPSASIAGGSISGFGNALGAGLSQGAQSLAMGASPMGALGLGIGAAVNESLGLTSNMGIQGLAAAAATALAGPLAGMAVGALSGFATNAIADAMDARDMEQTRDMAEDAFGHGITGLSAGKSVADAFSGAHAAGLSANAVGLAGAQAMADVGLAASPAAVAHGVSLGMQDNLGPEMGATVAASISDDPGIAGVGVLGGLAQTGLVGEDSMAMAAQQAAEAAEAAAAQSQAATDAAAAAASTSASTGAANAGTTGTAAAADSADAASADAGAEGNAGDAGDGSDGGGNGGDGGDGDGGNSGDGGDSDGGDGDGGGDGD